MARQAEAIRLTVFDRKATPAGTVWLVNGSSLTKMIHLARPDVEGTEAWSANGKVLVWRALSSTGAYGIWIWRFGS